MQIGMPQLTFWCGMNALWPAVQGQLHGERPFPSGTSPTREPATFAQREAALMGISTSVPQVRAWEYPKGT